MTEKTVERLNRVLEAIDPKHLDSGSEAGPMVEADRLFAQHRWPAQFHERYTNSATGRGRLAALKARVKHFIATEGRE